MPEVTQEVKALGWWPRQAMLECHLLDSVCPNTADASPLLLSLGFHQQLTLSCAHNLFLIRCERKELISTDQAAVMPQPRILRCL